MFKKKVFVLTGKRAKEDKKKVLKCIQENNGVICPRVTKDTYFLVATDAAYTENGTFITQTKEKQVTIIMEDYLFESERERKLQENSQNVFWQPTVSVHQESQSLNGIIFGSRNESSRPSKRMNPKDRRIMERRALQAMREYNGKSSEEESEEEQTGEEEEEENQELEPDVPIQEPLEEEQTNLLSNITTNIAITVSKAILSNLKGTFNEANETFANVLNRKIISKSLNLNAYANWLLLSLIIWFF
jgi:hypothetical protein